MYNFNSIIGNERLIKKIKNSLINKTDSHAYMFISNDKILRKEISFSIARAMLCENFEKNMDSCDECKSCITFDSSNNPDLKYITKDFLDDKQNKIISVDVIREGIIKDITFAPIGAKNKKIYIIEDADLMNENAQNALLKTLEEPNEYAKIFLLTGNEKAMLPTILSRCICEKIMPLNENQMNEWIDKNIIEKNYKESDDFSKTIFYDYDDFINKKNKLLENKEYFIRISMGSLEKLLDVLSDEDFETYKTVSQNISIKLLSDKYEDFLYCKKYLNEYKDDILKLLDILEVLYRDMLFARNNLVKNIINIKEKEMIIKNSYKYDDERFENAIKSINTYREDLTNYTNFKIATEDFQINISEV